MKLSVGPALVKGGDSMEIDAARLFALKLSVLDPHDREWVLARLEVDVQTRLRSLIGELDELGMCIDQDILATFSVSPETVEATPAIDKTPQSTEDWMLVDTASPQWIADMFADEPDIFRKALEQATPWAWRRLAEGRTEPGVPGQMTDRAVSALVSLLAQRMREAERAGRPGGHFADSLDHLQVRASAEKRGWFRWPR